MTPTTETGYLVIADLTGYTRYLASAELEHAPVIAGDLLETIIARLEPPFRLANLEGDAAFLYAEDGRADGSLLLDAIDAAYAAFRRRLRSIEQATDCDCQSCRRAPDLDLKFFVHHGLFIRSRIAGRDELAGSSVIVVHRLLKGPTAGAAHDADGRASGFVLVTGDAIRAMGIEPPPGTGRAVETIEHLGDVEVLAMDLERRWVREAGARRVGIDGVEPGARAELEIAASPATVWAHLTSPSLRPTWDGTLVLDDAPADGAVGVGSTSRCVTGLLATLEEVVDWQPFEHVGYRVVLEDGGALEAAYDLEPTAGGTRLRAGWWRDVEHGPGSDHDFEAFADAKRSALDRLGAVAIQEVHP